MDTNYSNSLLEMYKKGFQRGYDKGQIDMEEFLKEEYSNIDIDWFKLETPWHKAMAEMEQQINDTQEYGEATVIGSISGGNSSDSQVGDIGGPSSGS